MDVVAHAVDPTPFEFDLCRGSFLQRRSLSRPRPLTHPARAFSCAALDSNTMGKGGNGPKPVASVATCFCCAAGIALIVCAVVVPVR